MAASGIHLTTEEWELRLGGRVRAARLADDVTQADLARRADVSLGAVKNLEAGRGSSVRTLVRVVRALGRTDWLDALAPPVSVSPLRAVAAGSVVPRRRAGRWAGRRDRPEG